MAAFSTGDGRPEFLRKLLEIRNDPQVKRLALQRARDPDLAEDALDETYYAVAQVRHPERINDLRAYFCKVLIRKVNYLRYQLGAALVEDFSRVAESHQDECGYRSRPPRPHDESVSLDLLLKAWLRCFAAQRVELASRVAGRSPDSARYCDVIVTVAEWLLPAIITGDVSDANFNSALLAEDPEWFDEPGCAENTRHQRLSRARADIRALLRSIINRDDLYP